MTVNIHTHNKQFIDKFRAALYDCDLNNLITMRSLDFWRCEQGQLRENWVLVDLLHVYDQIGVDVFARMRELTYARQLKITF